VRYWLLAGLLLAFGSLAAARYLPAPAWIQALVFTGAFAALATGVAAAMGLRLALARWHAVAALGLGVAAALSRWALLAHLEQAPEARLLISFWRLALAGASVAWGLLATTWGSMAVSDAVDSGGSRRWLQLLGGSAGVAAGLYSVAPLLYLAGLTLNLWSVIGLFGLAAFTYGAGTLYRRILGR
jgi:hypothetical protein